MTAASNIDNSMKENLIMVHIYCLLYTCHVMFAQNSRLVFKHLQVTLHVVHVLSVGPMTDASLVTYVLIKVFAIMDNICILIVLLIVFYKIELVIMMYEVCMYICVY